MWGPRAISCKWKQHEHPPPVRLIKDVNGATLLIYEIVYYYVCPGTATKLVQWLLYVPPGSTFTNSSFCPHSVFMCFVWISEQTAIISLYSVNLLVFVTEAGSVYCAVRTVSLNVIYVNLQSSRV
jgi:hypothetical protein